MISKFINKLKNPLNIDSFWALIGNISLRGFGLISSIIIARVLGSEFFGEYGAIKNAMMSIAVLSSFGLGYTSTKHIAESIKNNKNIKIYIKKTFTIGLFFSLISAITVFAFSNYIAIELYNAPKLKDFIIYISIWVVFNTLSIIQIGVISGFGEYKIMAKINTTVGIVSFLLNIILTLLYQLQGAIIALVISQFLNWLLYYKELLRLVKIIEKGKEKENNITIKSIIKYSLPIALQEIIYSATNWVTFIIVIQNSSYIQLGIYNAALQWSTIVLFLPGVLRNVVLSNLSKAVGDDKNVIVSKMIKLNLLSTIIPVIIIIMLLDFIVGFYGVSFIGLKSALFFSLISSIFASVSIIYSQVYMSLNKNWLMLFFRVVRDSTLIIFTLVLLKSNFQIGGAMSLIFSTLFSHLFFMIVIVLTHSLYLKKINKYD